MEDADPGAHAAAEAFQVVFLVGAVDAVVVEGEAGEDDVHAEGLLEFVGDGDRAAAADEDGGAAPFGGEGVAGLGEFGGLDGEADGLARAVLDEFHGAVGGDAGADEFAEGFADSVGVLVEDESE